jgi:hypothetical protein
LTKMFGDKARQRVLDRYTLNENITHVEALYASVVTKPQRTRLRLVG